MKIAIDGGTRTGKTSIGDLVAKQLGLPFVSTGLLYRALAWLVLQGNQDPDNEAACDTAALHIVAAGVEFLDAEHIQIGSVINRRLGPDQLERPDVNAASSNVAVHPHARHLLLEPQRQAAIHGVVMEGRDIATVVLPEADLKFFLTVNDEERARRAMLKSSDVLLDNIRDRREATRAVAPMKAAEDATIIDTSHRSIEAVVDTIVAMAQPQTMKVINVLKQSPPIRRRH